MFSVIEGIDTFFMYIFVKIYFLHVVCQALQSSVFFFFLTVSTMACGSSRAKDQTYTTVVTQAAAWQWWFLKLLYQKGTLEQCFFVSVFF